MNPSTLLTLLRDFFIPRLAQEVEDIAMLLIADPENFTLHINSESAEIRLMSIRTMWLFPDDKEVDHIRILLRPTDIVLERLDGTAHTLNHREKATLNRAITLWIQR